MTAIAALASLPRGTGQVHNSPQSTEGKSLCPTP
jgi:hypothetical protein